MHFEHNILTLNNSINTSVDRGIKCLLSVAEMVFIKAFFNSLVPGRCSCNLELVIFKLTHRMDIFSVSCELPSDEVRQQPLSEPILTQFYITIWYHYTTMS